MGAEPAVEMAQFGPEVYYTRRAESGTELLESPTWAATGLVLPQSFAEFSNIQTFTTPVYSATVYGIGSDNPADPYHLTDLQKARSLIGT